MEQDIGENSRAGPIMAFKMHLHSYINRESEEARTGRIQLGLALLGTLFGMDGWGTRAGYCAV